MAITKIQSESLNLADDYTFTGTVAGAGESNVPAFYGNLASNTALSRNVFTKITGMTGSEIDTASAFDGTTFTVPSGQGGKYYVQGFGYFDFGSDGSDGEAAELKFRLNNSVNYFSGQVVQSTEAQIYRHPLMIGGMITLSAGDYLELYAQAYDGNGNGGGTLMTPTYFMGYKLTN